jgi:hypothetical protein
MCETMHLSKGKRKEQSVDVAKTACLPPSSGRLFMKDKETNTTFLIDTDSDLCFPYKIATTSL